MTETILILLISYLVGVFISYWYFRLAYYHKNGIFNFLHPETIDYIFTFFPGYNLLAGLLLWIFNFPIERSPRKRKTNIFKPRNYER